MPPLFSRTLLRGVALFLTFVVTAVFCHFNSFVSPPPDRSDSAFRLLLLSFLVSLVPMAFPLLPAFFGDLSRFRRWFSLPPKGTFAPWRLVGGFLLLALACDTLVTVMAPEEEQAVVRLLPLLGPAQLALVAIFLCVLAPLVEECLFRGIVLEAARPTLALPLSAALFALAHGLNAFLLPLFFIGWCLGLLTLRTRTLVPAILLHGAFNLLNTLLAQS